MLFRKKKNPTSAGSEVIAESGDNAAKIRALKRSMRRQIVTMSVCLVVATAATMTFLTTAWFARNEKVSSTNSNIRSNSATPSLYIRMQSEKISPHAYLDAVNMPVEESYTGLFPVSTGDLEHWWYASSFTYENNEGVPIQAMANGYTQVTNDAEVPDILDLPLLADEGTTDFIVKKYYNAHELNYRVAYYATKLNLYTVPGTYMDVYFNPDTPISVQYVGNAEYGSTVSAGEEGTRRDLLNALRVGVLVGNNRIIYAPVSEADEADKKGNDTSTTSANSFYCVRAEIDEAEVFENSTVVVNWQGNDYVASSVANLDTYTSGSTKLGTADSENGLDVTIFVWLEGTDADALVGISDGDIAGIDVTVSFVGTDGRTTEEIVSNEQA